MDMHKSTCEENHQYSNTDGSKTVLKTYLPPMHRRLLDKSACVAQDNSITSTTDANICEPPTLDPDPDSEELPQLYQITNTTIPQDLSLFLQNSKLYIHKILTNALDHYHQIQYNIVLRVPVSTSKITMFKSKFMALKCSSEIDDTIDVLAEIIPIELQQSLSITGAIKIDAIRLNVKEFSTITGGYLPLPKEIYESVFIVMAKAANLKLVTLNSTQWQANCAGFANINGINSHNLLLWILTRIFRAVQGFEHQQKK